MKRMGWSYSELMELPEGYYDPLIKMLRDETRSQQRANRGRR